MSAGRLPKLAAAALAATALLSVPAAGGSARRISDEPVRITLTAPATVALKKKFPVTVKVDADPGALDIAAAPLRLHVLLEPECGGSFEGSTGITVADRPLPDPAGGAAYSFTAKTRVRLKGFAAQSFCIFVTDSEQRQYATSTVVGIAATKACTKATKALPRLRKAVRKAEGAKRTHLKKKLRKAGKRKRKVCPAPVSTE